MLWWFPKSINGSAFKGIVHLHTVIHSSLCTNTRSWLRTSGSVIIFWRLCREMASRISVGIKLHLSQLHNLLVSPDAKVMEARNASWQEVTSPAASVLAMIQILDTCTLDCVLYLLVALSNNSREGLLSTELLPPVKLKLTYCLLCWLLVSLHI